jgi:FAD:protein FMN transferase
VNRKKGIVYTIFRGLVKSRHTREGGYPWTIQLPEKNGFPIKDFGNDGLKKTFYETIIFSFFLPVFSLLFFAFSLSSCTYQKESVYKKSKILMDTLVTITVVSVSQDKADKAIDKTFSAIEKIEKLSDFYSPVSEISMINRKSGISGVKVSPDILEMLNKALYVSENTEGAFDITIGPVMSLYDFHKKIKPVDSEIRRNLPLVNYRNLSVDKKKSTVFLKEKGMLVDPGGITKGYTADKAAEILKQQGIHAGLVAVAGDIKAFGLKPDGKPWKIGIRNPSANTTEDYIIATIELTDMAISTSGDYERSFIIDGKKYHHLIDPKTGYPASSCRSVSVIAKDGVFTDSFATGVFILGPDKGMKVLEKMGFDGVIIDSTGKPHVTQGIRGKVEFKRTPA